MTIGGEGKLAKTWEVSAFDRVNNEWTTTTNHSYSHEMEGGEDWQATPARITPSRRKPENRDHKVIGVISDAQIDYRRIYDPQTDQHEMVALHDERAIKLSQFVLRDLRPDLIVNTGDTVDLAALSRFDPDSNHFVNTMGPSFQRTHDMYAQLRSDNPESKIVEVDSNHNTRLKKFMAKNAMALLGVTRAGEQDDYPVMTYPYLANLKPLDVDFVSGYGAAEYVYGAENDNPIVFKHGQMVGSWVSKKEAVANPEVNIVRGHSHSAESYYRTNRYGKVLGSFVVGVLCRTDGVVPGYGTAVDDRGQPVRNQQNWQQGMMVIEDYDGDYNFNHLIFTEDGDELVTNYRGKRYSSSEDL